MSANVHMLQNLQYGTVETFWNKSRNLLERILEKKKESLIRHVTCHILSCRVILVVRDMIVLFFFFFFSRTSLIFIIPFFIYLFSCLVLSCLALSCLVVQLTSHEFQLFISPCRVFSCRTVRLDFRNLTLVLT